MLVHVELVHLQNVVIHVHDGERYGDAFHT